jgi:hypothetical protein
MSWMGRSLALAAIGLAACTIDPGAPPPPRPCDPAPDFFVSDVFPRYLSANRCDSGGCHAFADGHGSLRLRAPEAAPAPGTALEGWPLGWRENYLSALQLVRCDDPAASRLLTVPEGQSNLHPPGPVVLDRATATAIVRTWVTP